MTQSSRVFKYPVGTIQLHKREESMKINTKKPSKYHNCKQLAVI